MFAPGAVLRTTYDAFQKLLTFDGLCHEILADLESLYYQGKKEDFSKIALQYDALASNVEGMIKSLDQMAPGSYVGLPAYFRKFDFYCRFFLAPPAIHFGEPFVLNLTDRALTTELAGSKTTTLVELSRKLDLAIPSGFSITTNSFSYFLEYNDLRPAINAILAKINLQSVENLSALSTQLKELIENADIPPEIETAIAAACKDLKNESSSKQLFAVRSSALSEDGQCSFAGQYASYLHIDSENLLNTYLRVLSSKYSPEALAYRINCGLSDEEAPMGVMVLTMVDALSAGVIYTADPSGTEEETLFIHGTQGLGNAVVSGTVIPDVFRVSKKELQISTDNTSKAPIVSNKQVETLAKNGIAIENHFGEPQDIEWAMHQDGSIIYLQSRSLQIYTPSPESKTPDDTSKKIQPLFRGGVMAASGVASGNAWCVDSQHPLDDIEQGVILIIHETLPSYVRVLHQVSGVVAELGSAAGHFATVCREFGVPLLLGVGDDIKQINHGELLSLSADETSVFPGDTMPFIKKVPAYKKDKELPFFRKLHSVLDFITPLNLRDPQSSEFTPEHCRSLHDIIRFSHEKAVQTMFSIGDRCNGIKGIKKQLQTQLPFEVFIVDVDQGLDKSAMARDVITVDLIHSTPFQALWRGLNHPDIQWDDKTYYDWKGYDRMAMSDAFAFQSSSDSASYAVLGKDYLNMNIRFGYHFTVIDALCVPDSTTSYCSMRFAGGGGEFEGRELRIHFLTEILHRLGFDVQIKGDLLDSQINGIAANVLMERIESLGKLLGITKQMDMRLKDMSMVEHQVEEFFQIV